jgi:hypothetical protein
VSGRSQSLGMTGKPTAARIKVWIDSVSSATLPLLGGFSTTAVIVVSDDAANFRWPGVTIAALAIAAIVLILAVQFAYHARIYLSEWSDRKDKESLVPSQGNSSDADAQGITQKDDDDCERGLSWARWTRRAYDTGLVALLLGLGSAVAPHHAAGIEADLRWSVTVLAFVTCIYEVAWIVWDPMRRYAWIEGE